MKKQSGLSLDVMRAVICYFGNITPVTSISAPVPASRFRKVKVTQAGKTPLNIEMQKSWYDPWRLYLQSCKKIAGLTRYSYTSFCDL